MYTRYAEEGQHIPLLLVEDDGSLSSIMVRELSAQYQVTVSRSLKEARNILGKKSFAVVIIDIGLPDGSGSLLVPQVARLEPRPAIIMLTAESKTAAKVYALDAGADDYITKPFTFRELEARLRALTRRYVRTRQTGVFLTRQREQALFQYLWDHRGQVCSKDALINAIGSSSRSNSLEVHIARIRRTLKTESTGVSIQTRKGQGYVLVPMAERMHA